jgi:hypothetical protein
MIKILNSLYNLGQISVERYEIFRIKMLKFIVFLFVASFIGIIINLASNLWYYIKILNAIIGIFIILFLFYTSLSPKIFLLLMGYEKFGWDLNPVDPFNTSYTPGCHKYEYVLEAYAKFVGGMTIWMSFFFLVMSTFQISRNFWAIPIIYLAIIIILFMDIFWGIRILFTRFVIEFYTMSTIIIILLSFISPPIWKKAIGCDPFAIIRLNKPELLISDIDEQLIKNQEIADEKRLKRILTAIEKNQDESTLSPDDRDFLIAQRQKARDRSLPAMLKERRANNPSQPAAAYWWTDEIVIGPGEKKVIANVSNGDILRSWSSNGHRICEEACEPHSITAQADMTTSFFNINGRHTLSLEANGYTTTVRYLLTKQ